MDPCDMGFPNVGALFRSPYSKDRNTSGSSLGRKLSYHFATVAGCSGGDLQGDVRRLS